MKGVKTQTHYCHRIKLDINRVHKIQGEILVLP